jgi:hypothetical protein
VVCTGDENVTSLFAKYDIFEAAQLGLQRFMANVVTPKPPVDVHRCHRVFVSWVYPSAHVMM